ncbi:MAG: magnesium and cobalt transport protein CorA, partial [Candidatus Omnitrophica bacterium]|nr:magnesium and cobalt transport protein CorA [Candidatus Omnitrophota bacterium]
MLKRPKRVSNMPGLAPGAVVHVGEERTAKVKISVIDYDASQIKEKILDGAEKCIDFKNTETVSWINIDGIHDTGLIENIGKCYDLHPLIPEDIVNTTQRPKFEDYDSCIFIVLKMLSYNEKNKEIESEQVSLVLGRNFVL